MENSKPAGRVSFGVFEMDPRSGELRKHGFRIRLQRQPFDVLALLVERAGDVVTREELQQKLWPRDIAKAVLFLASDDAAAITGTTLEVFGGTHLTIQP